LGRDNVPGIVAGMILGVRGKMKNITCIEDLRSLPGARFLAHSLTTPKQARIRKKRYAPIALILRKSSYASACS
jgi:hypothetical protein